MLILLTAAQGLCAECRKHIQVGTRIRIGWHDVELCDACADTLARELAAFRAAHPAAAP